MIVRSGAFVTSYVKIVLGYTTVAALVDTSWNRVMCAKPMCQVQRVIHHTAVLYNMHVLLQSVGCLKDHHDIFKQTILKSDHALVLHIRIQKLDKS